MILRSDLPLGVKLAQTVHAVGESLDARAPPHTHAVVLTVPDEPALLALEARLRTDGVTHSAIREPDAPYCGALMAIGFPPQHKAALRRWTAGISLAK